MGKTKLSEHLYDKRYGPSNHHKVSGGGGQLVSKHYQNQDFINDSVRNFPGDRKNIHSDIRRTLQRLKENTPLILDNPFN